MCTLVVKLCSRSSVASLTVKLCCRSLAVNTLAASMLEAKLQVRSQQSLQSTRSFAATIVEGSANSSGSELRYTHSFSFVSPKQVDGPS